jgi:hypothetical protein
MANLKDLIYITLQKDIDGNMGFMRLDDHSVVDRMDITVLQDPPILLKEGKHYTTSYGDLSFEHPDVSDETNALLIGRREKLFTPAACCRLKEVPKDKRAYRLSG